MTRDRWTDPIVEEVRQVRDDYAASFGYDLDAIYRDLCEELERAREAGAEIVLAPKGTRRPAEPAA